MICGIVPGSKSTVERVLDVNNIEVTNVLLTVNNDTSSAHVTPTGDHDDVTGVELDEVTDLSGLQIELDSVVNLDGGVRVTDGTSVVGDNVGDAASTNCDLTDFAELVGSLLRGDTVDSETSLDIVKETEVLARLLDRYNI